MPLAGNFTGAFCPMFYSSFQDLSVLHIAAALSAVLSTYAYFPYALDTLAGRTRPQRASWLIWSVLGSIAVASQFVEGATHSLWFAATQVAGTIVIFLFSVRRGAGCYLRGIDAWVLLLAGLGIALWLATDHAVYALGISISISLLGGLCTVRKAYLHPESETLRTWLASFFAAGCALVAVGRVDPVLMAYPAYLLVLNGAIVTAMLIGRGWQTVRIA